jgi:PAS domain S-box-containing protein
MPSSRHGSQLNRADDPRDLREVNEALIAMSVRQHELIEQADLARRKAEALSAELRASEERLRESEGRFRTVLESSPMAVFVCDADAVLQFYNARAAELWGREPQLGVERHCGSWKLWRPDGALLPHEQSPIVEVLRTGVRMRNVEVFIERPDGSRLPVLVDFAALTDQRGIVTGAITSFIDISDRKQAELALQESETLNRGIFESSPDCVKVLDGEGRLLRINNNGLCIMEIDDFAPLAGCPWCSLWPEEERADVQATLEVARAGGIGRFQGHCPTAKGAEKWWDISVAAIRDANGKVLQFIAVSRDLTDRMQVERNLRDSEQRFRMVADNISQLAWTCDKLGNVTWYNQRWLDYTGLNFEAMKGWDWSKVQHPDHLNRVVARVKRSAETGEPWEDTFPLRGKDGNYRWFLSQAVPIRDDMGNVARWFGTNTDVTELRDAQLDLREADRRKSEFLAMLAHELRNPLAPIRNAVQVLRISGGDEEAVQSASEMMERQVGQMVRLVDDLLDVSRISRGKIELRRRCVELASIVHHAVEAIRPIVQSLSLELTVTLPPEPVYLDADPTRLAQVVGNLLTNACKFTEKGGRIWLTVEVARRAKSAPGDEAVIRVRDSGIGIAAEQLPRIFEMFTQVDTSLERSVSGLGIGLTLVKSLVELHGGTVEVSSAGLGHGSEFVVRLPITAATHEPSPDSTKREPTPAMNRRILVVDDNPDSATSLSMLLKITGNEVRTAADGAEAVAQAEAYRPEVILLDIGLPKMNGYDACRAIREQSWGKDMLLIALTGWGQEEDRQKSKDAGFNGHLVKPVEFSALQVLLASFDH